MAKNNKTNTTESVKTPRNFDRPMSLLMLFVVASIAYSTYVVYFGTIGIVPKIMLVPQALFAAIVAIHKFTK